MSGGFSGALRRAAYQGSSLPALIRRPKASAPKVAAVISAAPGQSKDRDVVPMA